MNHGLAPRSGFSRPSNRLLLSSLLFVVFLVAACAPQTPAVVTGSLKVEVVGLTSGAIVLVTGPGSYSATVTATTTLENLAPGDYTLEAAPAANYFVTGERVTQAVIVEKDTATATVTYVRGFQFTAASDRGVLPLEESAELQAELFDLHPDLAQVDVQLTQPGGWDLSATGPWTGATAGPLSTFVTDESAELGTNEFVFSVSTQVAGQALRLDVPVIIELAPIVTTAADDVLDPARGSLRWLVTNDRVKGHTVTFDPALAETSQLVIELQGQLEVRHSVNISGFAAPADRVRLTAPGGSGYRLLDIVPTLVTDPVIEMDLSRLEFVGGAAPGSNRGGAFRSNGKIEVTDSLFGSNSAQYGGAIAVVAGSLLVQNVTFTNNAARDQGGAIHADNGTLVTISSSSFNLNDAHNGGAVLVGRGGNVSPENRSTLLVEGSKFEDNKAIDGGGALMSYAVATVSGSTFERNSADAGGAIRNHYRMSIESETTVFDNEADRYGGVLSDGVMQLQDSVIEGNRALAGDGGGVYNGYADGDYRLDGTDIKSLIITNSRVVDNTATGNGAGVYNVQLLEIVGSTFDGNEAGGAGGGIFSTTTENNGDDNLRGTVLISGSTFSYNDAKTLSGGGIAVEVPELAPGPRFVMTNSTVAHNTAQLDGGGISLQRLGNIYQDEGVFGSISFSTVAFNTAIEERGGGIYTRYGELALRGNVIAENKLESPTAGSLEVDLYPYSGGATSHGYNWLTTNPQIGLHDRPTDRIGLPTDLGTLGDYGGTTETIRPGLSALGWELDDVPWEECKDIAGNQLTEDQRGLPRPGLNSTCYRGALEEQSAQ